MHMPSPLVLFIACALLLPACSRTQEADADCLAITMTDQADIRATLPTDAGMHGVWDPHAFKQVCSPDAWEERFLENQTIEALIRLGNFVPIYVHSDGTPLISVRIARNGTPAVLADAEAPHVQNRSDEYLFVSQGVLAVSGIEYIGGLASPGEVKMTPLEPGRWSVRVFELIAPPGPDGKPAAEIADFVVLVNPESSPTTRYRASVETFNE